ncbi:electron transport complex subunit RsxE [Natranaerofaba carboxydovora]|uniref:electron transport complex subunit RsxE n=1 Tax=Natranaerofaba carboxydovora TaxID=2742683 RepID=UPI001F13B046|nr:electron transport complex subunit E [Natranaerofaba carboxydovora]UMZ72848.1 Electron transport complex subunit RnfE [Natranaerofaba carboxydovora]
MSEGVFSRGILKDNPIFRQGLGLCPVLAVTVAAEYALGMGLATTVVLLGANIVVSLIKDFIPAKVRIPCYIVVIATFVTLVDMFLAAYLPDMHDALGIFIPLIVVNCLILGRAESFASKNSTPKAIIDAFGMGLGFTLGLVMLGLFREILGAGEVFGYPIMHEIFGAFGAQYQSMQVFVSPAGAFFGLGILIAAMNIIYKRLEV